VTFKDGIDEVINFMNTYNLKKEDREALLERAEHFGQPAPEIPTAVKTAFTKRYQLSRVQGIDKIRYNTEHFEFKKIAKRGKK
jgi:hypothetical protein